MDQTKDHDLLITISSKVDRLTLDVKDLREDLINRMAKAEGRLDLNDVYHAQIPLKEYDEIAKWTQNFRSNLKFMMLVSGLSLGVIGAVVGRILQILFHF